jgi:hypothetical protein
VIENKDLPENRSTREAVRIYDVDDRSDEIDLVDLWIFFWKRKSLFLSSAILVTIVGIVSFEMLYAPKQSSTVRSLVEVSEISVGSFNATNAYSAAVARRIAFVDLPGYASEKQFEDISSYVLSTTVSEIQGTSLIEILTNAPAETVTEVSRFHDRITSQMISNLNNSPYVLEGSLREQLVALDNGVRRLKILLNDFSPGIRRDDDALSLSKQAGSTSADMRLDTIMLEIDGISAKLKSMEANLPTINPRVVVVGSVSEKVSGIKKSTAYALIILLALFLALLVVAGSAFAARVKERMAVRG